MQFREAGQPTWLSENAPLEMDDGGSLTINIRLSHRPRGDVTVNVTFPTGSGLSTTTTLPFSFQVRRMVQQSTSKSGVSAYS